LAVLDSLANDSHDRRKEGAKNSDGSEINLAVGLGEDGLPPTLAEEGGGDGKGAHEVMQVDEMHDQENKRRGTFKRFTRGPGHKGDENDLHQVRRKSRDEVMEDELGTEKRRRTAGESSDIETTEIDAGLADQLCKDQ